MEFKSVMFNWTGTQSQVTSAIALLGFQITLVKDDDTTSKAYAVWDSNSKNDLAQGASKITGNQKQIYIAGNIKKVPVPGDYLKQGTDQWHIIEVEAYKPTTTVLAYRCIVQ
jgi:hypothetical protein